MFYLIFYRRTQKTFQLKKPPRLPFPCSLFTPWDFTLSMLAWSTLHLGQLRFWVRLAPFSRCFWEACWRWKSFHCLKEPPWWPLLSVLSLIACRAFKDAKAWAVHKLGATCFPFSERFVTLLSWFSCRNKLSAGVDWIARCCLHSLACLRCCFVGQCSFTCTNPVKSVSNYPRVAWFTCFWLWRLFWVR